eukprot:7026-Heterococcus_DN1.PRE.2
MSTAPDPAAAPTAEITSVSPSTARAEPNWSDPLLVYSSIKCAVLCINHIVVMYHMAVSNSA